MSDVKGLYLLRLNWIKKSTSSLYFLQEINNCLVLPPGKMVIESKAFTLMSPTDSAKVCLWQVIVSLYDIINDCMVR